MALLSSNNAVELEGQSEDSPAMSSNEICNQEDPRSYWKQMIHDALNSQEDRMKLLSSSCDEMAEVMNYIQEILDDPSSGSKPPLDTASELSGLRRLMIAMSRLCGFLPPSLFISNVECPSPYSVAGGGFADIFRGNANDKMVALKRLRVFCHNAEQGEKYHADFCREALLWRMLRHQYILPFMGVDRDTFPGHLCMVSPWMKYGNIMSCMDYLESQGIDPPVERWIHEIAEGLLYLHSELVIHGDLRGANILIDTDDLKVQLADFGLARFADSSSASLGSLSSGAVRWMAPEVLSGSKSTQASDSYSFGCVCVELYTRRPPFHRILRSAQVMAEILKGNRPELPEEMRRASYGLLCLVQCCWREDPSDRPQLGFIAKCVCPGQGGTSVAAEYDVVFSSTSVADRVDKHDVSDYSQNPVPIPISSQKSLLRRRIAAADSSSPFTVISSKNSSPFSMISSTRSSPFGMISSTKSSPFVTVPSALAGSPPVLIERIDE